MEKITISNRKNRKISALVQNTFSDKGIAIIMHGLGDNKNTKIIKAVSEIFDSNGYTTITFDATNSFGESEGSFENATVTNYYEDLEDVINWTKKQSWYKEPIILVGHSIGGTCSALIAEKFPSQIKTLILISPAISGELNYKKYPISVLDAWEKNGILEWEDKGITKKLKWQFMPDTKKYNLLEKVEAFTMPVLIISGENYEDMPVEHQRLFYNELPNKKKMTIIKNGEHSLEKPEQLNEVKICIEKWISDLS